MSERARRAEPKVRRLGSARRRVWESVSELGEPTTAEALVAALPDVHPSSVYRALGTLEEQGLVKHTHLAHGPALYSLTEQFSGVRHLVCETCGASIDVPIAVFDPLRDELRERFGFVLDAGHFALTGRCEACSKR